MMRGYFVTGTDTGVGKTLVASALTHALAETGLRVAALKPVAAGCIRQDGRWMSEDVLQLTAAANVALPHEVVNPYALEAPLAPHIAAERAGVSLDLDVIQAAVQSAARQSDLVVVEGVGGFRVPFNASEDSADLAQMLGLPVILVVGLRLGCLNHALLTAEAILVRRLPFAGWVGNRIDPGMDAAEENLLALRQRLPAPCLGLVPDLPVAGAAGAAPFLDLARLLEGDGLIRKNG